VSDFLWFFGLMWAAGFIGVGAWWAWYALVRFNQLERHAREVLMAARDGLLPPDPPMPPNVLHTWLRVNGIAAVIGFVLVGIALVTIALGTCSSR
jgi:hypothetical protein